MIGRYKEIKEKNKTAIQNAITTSWKQVCTRQENESIWQTMYRILKRFGRYSGTGKVQDRRCSGRHRG